MRKITEIVIHCSATKANVDIGAKDIRQWHVQGNGWRDIGYHYVIRRDGTVEPGRPIEQPGAHVQGHNANSIGICLVGGLDPNMNPAANYTDAQWATLRAKVLELKATFPGAAVKGHRDFSGVNKACPCFAVSTWLIVEGIK
ncbi:N-acetylmuramoyl-L-alanine amidase [Deltaproteobacteria bacterium]|nr:N-acetylmuramoyl-L-alanine amidase [Deltaproteobacteria bacterium]